MLSLRQSSLFVSPFVSAVRSVIGDVRVMETIATARSIASSSSRALASRVSRRPSSRARWVTFSTSSTSLTSASMRTLDESRGGGSRTEITFVRHGQSTWNAEGRIQGSSDASTLTEKGREQAESTRALLALDEFDACLRSPLKRASETAEIVWGNRKRSGEDGASDPFVDVVDLREIDLYAFEGLLKEEGVEKFGEEYMNWKKRPGDFEIDGHYPVRELWDRATSVWENVLTRQSHKRLLVVAHNAVNQALLGSALGLGPHYFRRLLQSNCAVSKVIIDKDFEPNTGRGVSLEIFNQTLDIPLGEKKTIVLIPEATSIEEEVKITAGVMKVLKKTTVGALLHGPDGAAVRMAEKLFNRCSREVEGGCPFELQVVNSVEDVLANEGACDRGEGSTFVIHEKRLCQEFIARAMGIDSGEVFNLTPGGITIINMKGGPAQDPVVVCVNHLLHISNEPDCEFH